MGVELLKVVSEGTTSLFERTSQNTKQGKPLMTCSARIKRIGE